MISFESAKMCLLCAIDTPIHTHDINAPWRRPFAWKFSWFMTRFYSIFYNRQAHFCKGLVVAVVIPQYSVVAWLQRAFCSHAPSQKRRVTWVAKVDQLGCFVSHLCRFLSLFIVPQLSFFHSKQRFTIAWKKKKKRARNVGDWGCGISTVDCATAHSGCGFWRLQRFEGDRSASGPALLCHCYPPVGEAVRATVGGPTEKQHKFQPENQ